MHLTIEDADMLSLRKFSTQELIAHVPLCDTLFDFMEDARPIYHVAFNFFCYSKEFVPLKSDDVTMGDYHDHYPAKILFIIFPPKFSN